MVKCTAPVNGHRTASGAANCPACGGRSRYRGSRSYSPPSSYTTLGNSSGSVGGRTKARWSRPGSSVLYTPVQVRTLAPIRQSVEKQAYRTDLRDVFLCHAWDDRNEAAKELHDLLEVGGVSVWFSPKDVALGTNLLREIDKGLAASRVGVVLVTPALLLKLEREIESIADKELSALLALDRLVPVVHKTTFEALRNVSPLLASKSGLDTAEESMSEVAAKLVETVAL